MRFVQLLLRDQAGLAFGDFLQTRVREMGDLVGRFGALQLIARGGDPGFGFFDNGGGLGNFVRHFGNFEFGEHLAFADTVAQIDVNGPDVAGDLRHHVHFLKRLELGGEDRCAGNAAAFDARHGYDGKRCLCIRTRCGSFRAGAGGLDERERERGGERD